MVVKLREMEVLPRERQAAQEQREKGRDARGHIKGVRGGRRKYKKDFVLIINILNPNKLPQGAHRFTKSVAFGRAKIGRMLFEAPFCMSFFCFLTYLPHLTLSGK